MIPERAVYEAIKRTSDVLLSLVALVVLSPVLLAIALVVRATSPGPTLYRGLRTGRGDTRFYILKFRSMVVNADKGAGTTSRNDPRITPVGRILRSYKLDELPQLINVFRGEMSFVGPRPELPRYTELYTPQERDILAVRPGITDLASVRFSDLGALIDDANPDTSFETRVLPEKNQLRLEYARNRSLLLDILLIVRTIGLIAMRLFRRRTH